MENISFTIQHLEGTNNRLIIREGEKIIHVIERDCGNMEPKHALGCCISPKPLGLINSTVLDRFLFL